MEGTKVKKTTFLKGTFITSFCIILTKVLGVLYVVPFHAIIGEKGGALYSYAYTIYLLFVSLFSVGIPLAISKMVSEYQALGYHKTKEKAFVIGKRISLLLGCVSCFLIVILAPIFAKLIFGDVVGGNNISDIVFVIRVIGVATLLGPLLSVYRGYFEGHRFMMQPSLSQVIEQLARITFIIIGSLIALKIFNATTSLVVGVALFGATIGIVISYIYLLFVYQKNKSKFKVKSNVQEPVITSRDIIKKIFVYSIPFIMIDLFKSFYNYVDMFSVVKGLVHYANYDTLTAETIYGIMSTWANKFNLIIYAIATGIIVNMIPNITDNLVKKNDNEVNNKIIQSLSILFFVVTPMAFGICFLSKPIWTLFYGKSTYGPSVLSYYIFVGLFGSLYLLLVNILQTLKEYKSVFICLFSGLLVKVIFNMSFVKTFVYFELPPYFGFITATILGFLVTIIVCLVILYAKYNVNFEKFARAFIDIMCACLVMIISLLVIKLLVPVYSDKRIINLLIILFYSLIGTCIYFFYSYKTGLFNNIFGNVKNRFKSLFKF